MTPDAEPRTRLAEDLGIWQDVANMTDESHLNLVRAISELADELVGGPHAAVAHRLRAIVSEHRGE